MSSNDFGAADFFGVNVLGQFNDMSQTCHWPQNVPLILQGDRTGHFQAHPKDMSGTHPGHFQLRF